MAHLLVMEGRWAIDLANGKVIGCGGKPIGSINGWGYVQLRVWRNQRHYGEILAHRLIWEYEHGRIADGEQVNHRNGIKHDNRLGNLEAVTPSENVHHAYRLGLRDARGSRNNRAVLTEQDIPAIRAALARGETGLSVAKRYGVVPGAISKIRHGKRWQHVPLEC